MREIRRYFLSIYRVYGLIYCALLILCLANRLIKVIWISATFVLDRERECVIVFQQPGCLK